MDNKYDTQEFDLDDILNEFSDAPEPEAVEADEELEALKNLPKVEIPQMPEAAEEAPEETAEEAPEEAAEEAAEETSEEAAPQLGDTIRMEQIIREVRAETETEAAVSQDATIRMDVMETAEVQGRLDHFSFGIRNRSIKNMLFARIPLVFSL